MKIIETRRDNPSIVVISYRICTGVLRGIYVITEVRAEDILEYQMAAKRIAGATL